MYRRLFSGLAPLVLVTAVVLISGCSTTTASNTPAVPAATATPLAENLTFHGDISGTITIGIDPRPLTHSNPTPNFIQQPDGSYFDPAPKWTQCSDFNAGASIGSDLPDAVDVIVGTINGKQYVVSVEINEDNPAYTKPGTALSPGDNNSGGSIEVYEVGGQSRRWVQTYGPATQAPVIVLHADRKSGTVDAWMVTTDQPQDGTATLHIQGDWRCG